VVESVEVLKHPPILAAAHLAPAPRDGRRTRAAQRVLVGSRSFTVDA
jgi:hypothetical protein